MGSYVADPGSLANGTIFYNSTSHKFKIVENGTTKILCNTTDAGCGAGGGSSWSSITDPSANLSLTMASRTSTFTYGNNTGSANLFNLTDTASNTGTGTLLNLVTANGSTLNPFLVTASSTTALVVTSGAKVGIGTTTPGSTLTVVGSVQLASLGTGVLHSSSFGVITSSSVVLTSDVSGVLPITNGGTGTTTLGNLTVGSNLSVTGGLSVLIGTSTQISLSANPSFTSIVATASSSLANASATALTVSGQTVLGNVSSTNESISGNLNVTGQTNLATHLLLIFLFQEILTYKIFLLLTLLELTNP